jgi:hypothetical protein
MNSSTLVACDRAAGRQDEHAAGSLLKTKIGGLATATRGSARGLQELRATFGCGALAEYAFTRWPAHR